MTLKNFNDYDVLLVLRGDSNSNKENEQPIQFATSDHVGNNRFTILLNLHRENFENALRNDDNEKCMDIIKSLVDTVCHQCVPNGRFLEQMKTMEVEGREGEVSYRDIGDGKEAIEVVCKALSQPCIDAKRGEVWSDDDDDTPLSNDGGDDNIDSAAIDGFMANYFVSLMSSPTTSKDSPQGDDDINDKKRRRKSSLLRRSVSDVGTKLNHSKSKCKRSFRRISSLFRPGIRSIDVTNYDVLCAYEQDENGVHAILTSSNTTHVGNTRFAIMTDLRRGKYEQAVSSHNFTERSSIVNDIVKTVHQTCSGRFLIQDDHTKLYHEMSSESAMASVEALLLNSSKTTATKAAHESAENEPVVVVPKSVSLSAPPRLNAPRQISDSTTLSTQNSTNSLPVPPPQPAGVNRRSSEVSRLRSAAIKSLLRKKQMKEVVDRHRQKNGSTKKKLFGLSGLVVSANIPTPGSIPSHLNNSVHSVKSETSQKSERGVAAV